MTFPAFIGVGGWSVHPHLFFELLGYIAGLALLLRLRHWYGDPIGQANRWKVVSAALIGGVFGSRLLEWPDGKSIVGGLIGGLFAVEGTKWWLGERAATGDLLALPLTVGLAIGRIGCFLTGLSDHTHGNPTSLPTGVDFGDGVRRHPTQLYEIAFLVLLALLLTRTRERPGKQGDQFRLFMIAYLSFRLVIEFIKPVPILALGLSSIQWASVATLLYYATFNRPAWGRVAAHQGKQGAPARPPTDRQSPRRGS